MSAWPLVRPCRPHPGRGWAPLTAARPCRGHVHHDFLGVHHRPRFCHCHAQHAASRTGGTGLAARMPPRWRSRALTLFFPAVAARHSRGLAHRCLHVGHVCLRAGRGTSGGDYGGVYAAVWRVRGECRTSARWLTCGSMHSVPPIVPNGQRLEGATKEISGWYNGEEGRLTHTRSVRGTKENVPCSGRGRCDTVRVRQPRACLALAPHRHRLRLCRACAAAMSHSSPATALAVPGDAATAARPMAS